MQRLWIFFAALAFISLTTASLAADTAPASPTAYYVCDCGPDCACDSISASPGNCKCGKPMAKMTLLKIAGGKAVFCTCSGKCACDVSETDPTKCLCNRPLKIVSLKGKYVCDCGPDCKCGAISDKPGNCSCGKPMKLVE